MAGAVGGGAGAVGRRTVTEFHHVPAERPLIDLPQLGARERHAEMLKLDDRRDRLAAHIFDRVLIAEPVRPLDGVVHVPAPVVVAHIAERGGDAALRRDRVAAGREHLADAGGLQPLDRRAEGGAQPGAAGPDDDDVISVFGDRISGWHGAALFLWSGAE